MSSIFNDEKHSIYFIFNTFYSITTTTSTTDTLDGNKNNAIYKCYYALRRFMTLKN